MSRRPIIAAVPLILVFALAGATTGVAFAQQAVDNPHGELEAECSACHSAEGWRPVRSDLDFDHASTGFALEHAHRGLACADCHASLRFGEVESDCAACHADVHEAELGPDCGFCHSTRSFIDVARQREMHRTTRFALTGAHAGLDCEACHVPVASGGLRYRGITTECFDCHATEYASADDPDHVAGGFLQRCDACHGTATWSDGFFNHERQLAGSTAVCVDCHRDDYDTTTDPPHAANTFPLQCEVCHDTRSWRGAFEQHDERYFPIFSGRHASEWDACSECHTVAGDFLQFDCLNCHPHSDRTETDGHHREERDYRYESRACYQCHPRGRSE